MKIVKGIIVFLLTSILSLVLLFLTFEIFSQYHFGDVPTAVVKAKLLIGYIIIEGNIISIYRGLNKKKKEKNEINNK